MSKKLPVSSNTVEPLPSPPDVAPLPCDVAKAPTEAVALPAPEIAPVDVSSKSTALVSSTTALASVDTSKSSSKSRTKKKKKKVYANPKQWCTEMATLQLRKATPEMRRTLLMRAKQMQSITRNMRKAAKKKAYSSRSKTSWMSSTVRMRSTPVADWSSLSATNAYEQRQVRTEMARENDDEALEEATCTTNALVLAPTTSLEEPDDDAAVDKTFKDLLKDFEKEPTDDKARAAKFNLYEQYAETVSASRKDTMDFWENCKVEFAGKGTSQLEIQRQVDRIDREENLSINFEARQWFVHGMTCQSDRNEKQIRQVLSSIKTKLELLSAGGECPICLEELEENDATILGCCHKVCSGCWAQWKSLRHGRAFCPLCRYQDFVSALSDISGVTPSE